MKAGTAFAAAVVSLCVLAARADRASERGLIGSLFPQAASYAPVDVHPPALPPLKAAPAALPQAPVVAQVQAPAPPPAEAIGMAPVPELAGAGPDELVAFNAPTGGSPSSAAPEVDRNAWARSVRLRGLNVLDAGARERRAALDPPVLTAPASSESGAPCADGCSMPGIYARPNHDRVALDQAHSNLDMRWHKLPCSKPGAYRYEVLNHGRREYTSVVLYDGDRRWDVGTLGPGRSVVIASPQPLGPHPAVDHDPVFVSAWDP